MERRRDVRVSLDQKVRVTVLGMGDRQIDGRAEDLSGRGIRILMPARIATGDAVRIDLDDAILLGEVCYCQPHNGSFMMGVQLDQALTDLAGLASLNEALLQDGKWHSRAQLDIVRDSERGRREQIGDPLPAPLVLQIP